MQQTVEYLRRLACGRRDHFGVEGCVAIRDVRVEGDRRLAALVRIDGACRLRAPVEREVLSVGA